MIRILILLGGLGTGETLHITQSPIVIGLYHVGLSVEAKLHATCIRFIDIVIKIISE